MIKIALKNILKRKFNGTPAENQTGIDASFDQTLPKSHLPEGVTLCMDIMTRAIARYRAEVKLKLKGDQFITLSFNVSVCACVFSGFEWYGIRFCKGLRL